MHMSPIDLVAEAKSQITEIEPAAAWAALPAATLLDVRETAEFEQCHLPGAINIPRGVLEFKIGEHPRLSQRDTDILVYCRTSGRAALAAANLQRMGYTVLIQLAGRHHQREHRAEHDHGHDQPARQRRFQGMDESDALHRAEVSPRDNTLSR